MATLYIKASLFFLSCAGAWGCSVSGETVLRVGLGDTVTLPCDLRLQHETTWFMLQNGTLSVGVLANKNPGQIQMRPFSYVRRPDSRFSLVLNPSTNSSSLRIEGVTETDQGLYYCATRDRGEIHIGKGTRIHVGDRNRELLSKAECPNITRPSGIDWPCLTILVVTPPLSTLLTSCCIFCLFYRPGRRQDRKGHRGVAQGKGRQQDVYEIMRPAGDREAGIGRSDLLPRPRARNLSG
ncbi:uncharacterized protein [Lepisosteus oculatus]|uniref:uncharacterized protein n=1 Tax=Lepisosteus oculatus TaxID=7918 RepID=UPI0035F51575